MGTITRTVEVQGPAGVYAPGATPMPEQTITKGGGATDKFTFNFSVAANSNYRSVLTFSDPVATGDITITNWTAIVGGVGTPFVSGGEIDPGTEVVIRVDYQAAATPGIDQVASGTITLDYDQVQGSLV